MTQTAFSVLHQILSAALSGGGRAMLPLALIPLLLLLSARSGAAPVPAADLAGLAAYSYKQESLYRPPGYSLLARDEAMAAAAYRRDADGQVIIVFFGTRLGNPEDFAVDLGIMAQAEALEDAIWSDRLGTRLPTILEDDDLPDLARLDERIEKARIFLARWGGGRPVLTGHSLGGFIAQVLAQEQDTAQVDSFNAPGALSYVACRSGSTGLRNQAIVNHVRLYDRVGRVDCHIGQTVAYPDVMGPGDLTYDVIFTHSSRRFALALRDRSSPLRPVFPASAGYRNPLCPAIEDLLRRQSCTRPDAAAE